MGINMQLGPYRERVGHRTTTTGHIWVLVPMALPVRPASIDLIASLRPREMAHERLTSHGWKHRSANDWARSKARRHRYLNVRSAVAVLALSALVLGDLAAVLLVL
jgi:hypothetical protein